MGTATLFMVLPAYNEEESLLELLSKAEQIFETMSRLGHNHRYIICDDGSRDAMPQILQECQARLPLTVITHEVNQGLGPTLRDGLQEACKLSDDDDVIVTLDADNTHPPALIMRMTQMLLEGTDVVIASRYRPGARVVGLSCFRRFMSFGARLLFQLLFPVPGVRDYTCGYRAYRARVLKEAFRRYNDSFVEHQGFQCMADILLKLSRMKVIMNEVPMILRYDLKRGASKMRVGPTVMNTLKLMLRRRLAKWG